MWEAYDREFHRFQDELARIENSRLLNEKYVATVKDYEVDWDKIEALIKKVVENAK